MLIWQDSGEVQVMQVGVFDFDGAMGRLGGDEELFREIVQFFFEDSPGLLDKLRCGLRDQNASAVERSPWPERNGSQFRAQRAIEAALRVENLGASGNLAEVPDAVRGLEEEIGILKVALSPYVYNAHGSRTEG